LTATKEIKIHQLKWICCEHFADKMQNIPEAEQPMKTVSVQGRDAASQNLIPDRTSLGVFRV
jgi:hypothetical protein